MKTISETRIREIVRRELRRNMLREGAESVQTKSDLKSHFLNVLDKIGDEVQPAEIQSIAMILDKAVEIADQKNLKSIASKVVAAMGSKANVKEKTPPDEK